MRLTHRIVALLLATAALWLAYASVFTVDVTQYAAVSRFGAVVRLFDEPGLGLKYPFERVIRLDKRLLHTLPPQAEYLTKDKKNLVVHSLASWRIIDPLRFLRSVTTRDRAEARLIDTTLAEIGAVLGHYEFSALIAASSGEEGFRSMVAEVRDRVNRTAVPAYGISVVEIWVRRLGLPEQNQRNVFQRMQAERGKIAMQHRSEGEQQAQKIIAAAEAEKTRMAAEAYRDAERIKGAADAEMMRIYARSSSVNRQFYKFYRTLEAYERILNERTTMFLPADAAVLRMLQNDSSDTARP